MSNKGKKAVVLLSGGLDSATVLAMALDQGFECYAMSFDYGQRHRAELDASAAIAKVMGAKEHRVMPLSLGALGGSALTDDGIDVPLDGESSEDIPVTYVPARNTVFLSFALAWAEVIHANAIFLGVNAVDYSGYPDCRPEFVQAFETLGNLATKAGVEGERLTLHAPLIDMTKSEIVAAGSRLGVDYSLTVSCYQADENGRACGHCDSCLFRAQGFKEAGLPDPTRYII